jgi:hypothetical protein
MDGKSPIKFSGMASVNWYSATPKDCSHFLMRTQQLFYLESYITIFLYLVDQIHALIDHQLRLNKSLVYPQTLVQNLSPIIQQLHSIASVCDKITSPERSDSPTWIGYCLPI